MKNVTIVYPPFCSPASPPYSLGALSGLLKKHLASSVETTLFDANTFYYNKQFSHTKADFKRLTENLDLKEYDIIISEYKKEFDLDQSKQHKLIVAGEKPELLGELINQIAPENCKPDIVAFSIYFSSQIPYAYALIKELKKEGITTVVGGPSMSHQLIKLADNYFTSYIEFLKFLAPEIKDVEKDNSDLVDFSFAHIDDYFTSEFVLPLKTSTTCYYRKCTFCTHHTNECYAEYSIEKLRVSLEKNKPKFLFLIDDMIPKGRLLELSKVFAELDIKWMCQLKPTKAFDFDTLKTLYNNGLRLVLWGVESASQRVLNVMKKGTKVADVKQVLQNSKKAGVSNATYIMFGFPTETKEEFLETIEFLKQNTESIDLVSSAIFGLQQRSYVHSHPDEFNINDIRYRERTLLNPAVSYTITSGLTTEDTKTLRKNYKKTLRKINKFPKCMNLFREHHLLYLDSK